MLTIRMLTSHTPLNTIAREREVKSLALALYLTCNVDWMLIDQSWSQLAEQAAPLPDSCVATFLLQGSLRSLGSEIRKRGRL